MRSLYEIIAEIATDLPPDRLEIIAKKIWRQPNRTVNLSNLEAAWGSTLAQQPVVQEFCQAAKDSGKSPEEVGSAMLGAVETMRKVLGNSKTDILWTGPQTKSVPVRRTEQALCELIESARERLFVVSFVAYKAEKIYKAVREAIDRGVKVAFMTEASKEHGGSLEVDPSDMLKEKFPEAVFYRWENPDARGPSVVHAKCAIADDAMALITSANLTGAAMDNNMELGVLIKDKKVAGKLAEHFMALSTENVIKRI